MYGYVSIQFYLQKQAVDILVSEPSLLTLSLSHVRSALICQQFEATVLYLEALKLAFFVEHTNLSL